MKRLPCLARLDAAWSGAPWGIKPTRRLDPVRSR